MYGRYQNIPNQIYRVGGRFITDITTKWRENPIVQFCDMDWEGDVDTLCSLLNINKICFYISITMSAFITREQWGTRLDRDVYLLIGCKQWDARLDRDAYLLIGCKQWDARLDRHTYCTCSLVVNNEMHDWAVCRSHRDVYLLMGRKLLYS